MDILPTVVSDWRGRSLTFSLTWRVFPIPELRFAGARYLNLEGSPGYLGSLDETTLCTTTMPFTAGSVSNVVDQAYGSLWSSGHPPRVLEGRVATSADGK